MSRKLIGVVVIEDSLGTRDNLVALLNRTNGIKCVGAFSAGEDAVREVPPLLPEVALVDINLPGMNGIKCVAQLKEVLPKTQFLMLTSYEDSELIFESLQVGASGYLMKNIDPDEILEAVEEVHAGGSPMSMNIARKVVNHFRQIVKPSSDMEKLTEREQEVLALLAQGFLYKEIGDRLGISLHTVRGHVHLVYEKLHVQSRTEAVLKYLGKK
jgi:DNA-binding NarL/FixJ family response regulator